MLTRQYCEGLSILKKQSIEKVLQPKLWHIRSGNQNIFRYKETRARNTADTLHSIP